MQTLYTRGPETPAELYSEADAEAAMHFLSACLNCAPPAPCVQHCPQGLDIQALVRWTVYDNAARRLPVRGVMDEEEAATWQIANEICAAYN